MGSGKPWRSIPKGSDFIDEAKVFIKSEWGIEDEADKIHLCCYVAGCDGRTVFSTAEGYWNLKPTTRSIFFWVGPQQKSPARDIAELRMAVKALETDVKRLKAVSGTTKDQLDIWNQRSELSIEKFDQRFVPINVNNSVFLSVQQRLSTGPQGASESHVQDMWNKLMPYLTTQTWKDCRNPNGIQFDGRRHDIDLVLLTKDVLSILYLDSSIELKDSIATDARRREVVLQLLDRFGATFAGQPERKVCWGVGMDAQRALFVRCETDMAYAVTANLDLHNQEHLRRLWAFMSSSAANRGYVELTLPKLFGTVVSSRLGKNVYLLEDGIVCKVGKQETVKAEHDVLERLNGTSFLTLDVREDETFDTGCTDDGFQFGFRMTRYDAVRVVTEEDVALLAGHIFWRLGALHHLGVVHRDIKPYNILSGNAQQTFLLCDYGAAKQWRTGDEMMPAVTEEFSSLPGEFAGTENSLFLQDLESLFWSVFLLWLQVIKKRDSPGRFGFSRKTMVSVLGVRGGVLVGEEEELVGPTIAVLHQYLVGQAKSKTLQVPSTLFSTFYNAGMEYKDFNAVLAQNEFLACPEEVFVWLRDNLPAVCNHQG